MNWNGQRPIVEYYEKVLSDPSVRAAEREKLAAFRRKRAYDSLLTRPVYLPLQFTMDAAGRVNPYRDTTPQLGYDVVITGIKTDCWIGNGRDITFQLSDGSETLVRTGNADNLFLRTDDIAGCTVDAGGGQVGVFYLPQPFLLRQDSAILVEMFKTDTTGSTEVANIVLIGYRVLPAAYANVAVDIDERQKIEDIIRLNETPKTRILKIPVAFAAAAVGSQLSALSSPRIQEPILLRGMRTTLRHSTLEIGIEGESDWMTEQVPIWAVADENEQGNDNYIWFSKPIFLHSNNSVVIRRIVNGNIDQANVDATTGGQISFIYDTI